VDALDWDDEALTHGKRIKIKGFPKDHKVHLFRVEVSTHRTDFVMTNDLTQDATEATQEACGFRWKIEQWHREGKQVTGLARCQCRKARIQRNHIGCGFFHPGEALEVEHVVVFAMIVSRDGYLQAVCTECEFIGNDCELEGLLVVDQRELKSVMFASRAG
jgi:hypothetical protein